MKREHHVYLDGFAAWFVCAGLVRVKQAGISSREQQFPSTCCCSRSLCNPKDKGECMVGLDRHSSLVGKSCGNCCSLFTQYANAVHDKVVVTDCISFWLQSASNGFGCPESALKLGIGLKRISFLASFPRQSRRDIIQDPTRSAKRCKEWYTLELLMGRGKHCVHEHSHCVL